MVVGYALNCWVLFTSYPTTVQTSVGSGRGRGVRGERPQDGLELESSALDHSATKPCVHVHVVPFRPQRSRGAMASAPDFESGGWGFESLRDRFAIQYSAIGLVVKYLVANEVPRVRFPDGAYLARVAQLVAPRSYVPMAQGSSPCRSTFCV